MIVLQQDSIQQTRVHVLHRELSSLPSSSFCTPWTLTIAHTPAIVRSFLMTLQLLDVSVGVMRMSTGLLRTTLKVNGIFVLYIYIIKKIIIWNIWPPMSHTIDQDIRISSPYSWKWISVVTLVAHILMLPNVRKKQQKRATIDKT